MFRKVLIIRFGTLNIKWFILESRSVLMTTFLPIGDMIHFDKQICLYHSVLAGN